MNWMVSIVCRCTVEENRNLCIFRESNSGLAARNRHWKQRSDGRDIGNILEQRDRTGKGGGGGKEGGGGGRRERERERERTLQLFCTE